MLGRLPPPTGDLRADAIAEIRWAMAGEGLTADKLLHMLATMRLPAVRNAVDDVPAARRLSVAYDVLADTARGLGGSEPFHILRTALGIDYAGRARHLTERRRQFGHVGDTRTIRDIERHMVEALVTALGGIAAIAVAPPSAAPQHPTAGLVWNVPLVRDPYFVGRDDVLAVIDDTLVGCRTATLTHTVTHAVSGVGGIGKTALAAEYAFRHASDYRVVWWLRAEQPDTLASDYAALATALNLPGSTGGQAEAVAATQRWLSGNDAWLLVFDNARNPGDIESYVPGLHGHALVTSRNPYWSSVAVVVDVPPLELEAATQLVVRRTRVDDHEGARLLAEKLDGIPKLIEVAAGLFVRGTSPSLTQFAAEFDGRAAEAAREVWDAAFDRVARTRGVRRILAACTVVNPDDVDMDLIRDALGLAPHTADAAVSVLQEQQILRRRVDGFAIHRLVQAAARERIPTGERRRVARRIVAALTTVDTDQRPTSLPAAHRAQAHTPYVLAALEGDADKDELLRWYARRLIDDGAYSSACEAARHALAITERTAGPGHPDTARCLNLLARALQDLGDHAAAKDAARRAVDIVRTALGTEHADVGQYEHTLARILRNLGEPAAALQAAQHAYAVTEHALGPDHAETGRRLVTLAAIHRDLGEFAVAHGAAERGMAVLRTALESDHADVGWSLGVLALVRHDLGTLDIARDAAEQALAVTEAALGAEHPDVGWYHGVLARILRDLGDLAPALRTGRRALAVTEAALGPGHPNVGWDLDIVATILHRSGDLDAARRAAERAVAITEAALGAGHPDVRERRDTLARIGGDLAGRSPVRPARVPASR